MNVTCFECSCRSRFFNPLLHQQDTPSQLRSLPPSIPLLGGQNAPQSGSPKARELIRRNFSNPEVHFARCSVTDGAKEKAAGQETSQRRGPGCTFGRSRQCYILYGVEMDYYVYGRDRGPRSSATRCSRRMKLNKSRDNLSPVAAAYCSNNAIVVHGPVRIPNRACPMRKMPHLF